MTDDRDKGHDEASPASGAHGHILVVDDDPIIQVFLSEILSDEGFTVACVDDGQQAMDLMNTATYDLVITDMVLPGRFSGIDLLRVARDKNPNCRVMVMTGYHSVDVAQRVVSLGAADYVPKPFNVQAIKARVGRVLGTVSAVTELPPATPHEQFTAIDQPTDVYSFEVFAQLLASEVGRSEWRGHMCTLLIAGINDLQTHIGRDGSGATDGMLQLLVRLLRQVMRPGDTMGRIGAAELGTILPETGLSQATQLGKQFLQNMDPYFTVSVGLACYPLHATNSVNLIKQAGAALEAARQRGGNALRLP